MNYEAILILKYYQEKTVSDSYCICYDQVIEIIIQDLRYFQRNAAVIKVYKYQIISTS